jgi:hypothetical protein
MEHDWTVVVRDDTIFIQDDNGRSLFNMGECSGGALEDASSLVNGRNSHATHLSTIEAQAKTIEAMREALAGVMEWYVADSTEGANKTYARFEKARSALALAQTEKAEPADKHCPWYGNTNDWF